LPLSPEQGILQKKYSFIFTYSGLSGKNRNLKAVLSKGLIRVVLLCFCIGWQLPATAQPDSLVIRASQLKTFLYLRDHLGLWIDKGKSQKVLELLPQQFDYRQSEYIGDVIPVGNLLYPHYVTFTILNDRADTAVFYCSSEPEEELDLMAVDSLGHVQARVVPERYKGGFVFEEDIYPLRVKPHQRQRYVMRVVFPKHTYSDLHAWLMNEEQLDDFSYFYMGIMIPRATFDLVFCGMLLMMMAYILLKYVQLRSSEYLYYAGYIAFFLGYFAVKTFGVFYYAPMLKSPFLYSYMGRVMQVSAYCMYFLFFRKFLETTDQRINGIVKWLILGLITYMIVDLYLLTVPSAIGIQNTMWHIVRIGLLSLVIYTIVVVRGTRSKIGLYLLTGSSALGFFASLSMVFSLHPSWIDSLPFPFDQGLAYFQIGIILEVLCFTLGLGYKNRMAEIEKTQAEEKLKLEAVRLTFERYKAVTEVREAERGRIAKDLHDGIGGMLSGLKFSMAALRDHTTAPEERSLLVQRNIDMLDSAMQELRRVSHDMMPQTLVKFGLVKALQDYCDQIVSMKTLRLTFQCFGEEKRIEPTHEIIIYRIVQELVNNILKHSGAHVALVQLVFQSQMLSLTVEDDGKGFDETILEKSVGSGWPNIRSRVEYLKGSLDVRTAVGKGTSVGIEIILP
jgi:signal transduction histidine kinase